MATTQKARYIISLTYSGRTFFIKKKNMGSTVASYDTEENKDNATIFETTKKAQSFINNNPSLDGSLGFPAATIETISKRVIG